MKLWPPDEIGRFDGYNNTNCYMPKWSSPNPLKITSGPFNFFENSRRCICKSRCTTDINDTGGKFCHQYCWCCWYPWQICYWCQRYLQQICLELQISPWIFEKIWNGPNGIVGNLFMKKPEFENLVVALSLYKSEGSTRRFLHYPALKNWLISNVVVFIVVFTIFLVLGGTF